MWILSESYGFLLNTSQIRMLSIDKKDDQFLIEAITQQNENIVVETFKSDKEAKKYLHHLLKDLNARKSK